MININSNDKNDNINFNSTSCDFTKKWARLKPGVLAKDINVDRLREPRSLLIDEPLFLSNSMFNTDVLNQTDKSETRKGSNINKEAKNQFKKEQSNKLQKRYFHVLFESLI